MQEIELPAKKKFHVKYEGQVYEVRKPTLGESRVFSELQKNPETSSLGTMIDHLAKLGLPREVSENLDEDQLEALFEKLSSKKN